MGKFKRGMIATIAGGVSLLVIGGGIVFGFNNDSIIDWFKSFGNKQLPQEDVKGKYVAGVSLNSTNDATEEASADIPNFVTNNKVQLPISGQYGDFLKSLTAKIHSYCANNRPSLANIDVTRPVTIEFNGNQVIITGDYKNNDKFGNYSATLENNNASELTIFTYADKTSIDPDQHNELLASLIELVNDSHTTISEFKAGTNFVKFDKINSNLIIQKAISGLTDTAQIENLKDSNVTPTFSSTLISNEPVNNVYHCVYSIYITTTEYTYNLKYTFETAKHLTGATLSNKATEYTISGAECEVTCEKTSTLNKAIHSITTAENQSETDLTQ